MQKGEKVNGRIRQEMADEIMFQIASTDAGKVPW